MEGQIAELWRSALFTVALVGSPFICAALVVGLVTALLQAATQLQENVLTFAPKIAAVGLVLAAAGPWVLAQLVRFSTTSMNSLVEISLAGR